MPTRPLAAPVRPMTASPGIHHVTAIAGDAQENRDFYEGFLGLRTVKTTVNYDDPFTYHLYYGDETGRPGSLLTFFPWPRALPGAAGTGQAAAIALAIVPESLGFWIGRAVAAGVAHAGPEKRLGQSVLTLRDPDGLAVELVTDPAAAPRPAWTGAGMPADAAIRGLYGVTLWVAAADPTAAILTDVLHFTPAAAAGTVRRFGGGGGEGGGFVDVRETTGFPSGAMGPGAIHHVAFRAADDAAQEAISHAIHRIGLAATPRIDRTYFHSVYFHEPGGVLFEIATDGPGFGVDEPSSALGAGLILPPQLAGLRDQIEANLPALGPSRPPRGATAAAASDR